MVGLTADGKSLPVLTIRRLFSGNLVEEFENFNFWRLSLPFTYEISNIFRYKQVVWQGQPFYF